MLNVLLRPPFILVRQASLLVFLLPLLLLLTLPAAVQAEDYTYTTSGGTITITGYTGPGGAVTIPSTINGLPVTSIGYQAFYNRNNVTSVTIPNSVTNIGNTAFSDCTSLTAITVHTSNPTYSSVDGLLFNKSQTTLIQCPGDKAGSYTIPNSVTSIEWGAFSGCTRLTSVTIPNSVTNIGEAAFSYCTSLSAITVDTNNSAYSSVDGVLFNKSQTTLIQWPGGKAGSYTIPNSVASIGYSAFRECTSLTSITIPDSVTSIGLAAFSACTSLTSVAIPNSVTNIEDWAFGNCTSLTAITVDSHNSFYSSADGILFNQSQTTLIQCPGGKAGSYTIPNSVTTIRYASFENCTSLTNVTVPNGVNRIGDEVFYGCTSLTAITIPNSVTNIGRLALSGCISLTGVYF